MKTLKIFLFSIVLILSITTGLRAEFFSDVIVTGTNAIWTDSRAYTNLPAAINAVGGLQRTIVIASQQSVGNMTIPANVTLKFERDGAIINSGQLTINTKNILAENRQIFAGAGDIDFASGSVLKSGWFSTFERAIDVTSDDTVTMLVTKAQTLTTTTALGNNVTLKWESPGNILTVNAGVTISNIGQVVAGNYQLFAGAGNFRFRDGTILDLSWFAHLRSAISHISTNRITLRASGVNVVDYSDAILSNITLDMDSMSGQFSITPGATLDMSGYSGPIYAHWFGTLTSASINTAVASIGTGTADMLLRPGAWAITSAVVFTDKIQPKMAAGAYFSISGAGSVTGIKVSRPEMFSLNTSPGTTDMLASINYAIAAAPEIEFEPYQSYSTTSAILVAANNKVIKGNKAKIECNGVAYGNAMYITGDDIVVDSLEIDGNNKAQIGIAIEGANRVMIKDAIVHDLYYPTICTYGIWSKSSTFVTIQGGEVYNITNGDPVGASLRGILFDLGSQTDIMIDGVTVHDVEGYGDIGVDASDGDLIKIGADAVTTVVRATIQNCTLYNFYKRAIKIQASGVIVKNNHITSDHDDASTTNPSIHVAIASFGDDVLITDNIINMRLGMAGIGIYSSSKRNIIRGNSIQLNVAYDRPTVYSNVSQGIYVTTATGTIIANNAIKAVNYAIRLSGAANDTTIIGNNFTTSTACIKTYSTTLSGLTIEGNSFHGTRGVDVTDTASGILFIGNRYYTTDYGVIVYDTANVTGNMDTEYYDPTVTVKVYYNQDVANRILNKVSGQEGTIVWDPGNLADGDGETSGIVSIYGATFGDYVIVTPPYSLQGIIATGFVFANENVRIRIQNETAGAIDLASGTWKVKVIK